MQAEVQQLLSMGMQPFDTVTDSAYTMPPFLQCIDDGRLLTVVCLYAGRGTAAAEHAHAPCNAVTDTVSDSAWVQQLLSMRMHACTTRHCH